MAPHDSIEIKKESIWKYSTIILIVLIAIAGLVYLGYRGNANASLSPPVANSAGKDIRQNPDVTNDPFIGNLSSPVTVVEFTDFQCPFCGNNFVQTYPQIKQQYIDTGKIKYYVKEFPLTDIHPEAEKAAEAALCVRDQLGDAGFFKMHDLLFLNQQNLSIGNEKQWARSIGADGSAFDICIDSGKNAAIISNEESYGQTLGIAGTPTFFIDGIKVEGAYPFSTFKSIIDSELSKL